MRRHDSVDRDLCGCIQMLRCMRGAYHTASVGAFVVVLTLAFDPFLQQLV